MKHTNEKTEQKVTQVPSIKSPDKVGQMPAMVIFGADVLQVPLIEAVKKRKWLAIVVDKNKNAPGVDAADIFIKDNPNFQDSVLQELDSCKTKIQYCGTIGTDLSDRVAAVNERFYLGQFNQNEQTSPVNQDNIPVNPINKQQALVTTHKGHMRDFLRKHNMPQPKYFWGNEKKDIALWMESNPATNGYVIKPVKNMGARGVMLIQTVNDLGFAYEFALSNSKEAEVIIEEYIPGQEFSIDTLSYNDTTWTMGLADRIIKIQQGRFFIETGHNMPSSVNSELTEKIRSLMHNFSKALATLSKNSQSNDPNSFSDKSLQDHKLSNEANTNTIDNRTLSKSASHDKVLDNGPFYNGPLKGDIRLNNKGELIIGEIASRLSGGFMSTHTYPLSSGVNVIDCYLDILSNKIPKVLQKNENQNYTRTVIERSIIVQPGKIIKLESPINEEPALCYHHFNYKEGDYISAVKSNVGKTGHFVISGTDLNDAEHNWGIIKSKIEIISQPALINENIIRRMAQKNFNQEYCWVCRECDGINCASGVPGMGGTGTNKTFQVNVSDLRKVTIQASYLMKSNFISNTVKQTSNIELVNSTVNNDTVLLGTNKNKVNLRTNIFGIEMNSPIFTAPVTGTKSNMGGSITEYDYAMETAQGATLANLVPMFGDGGTSDKYHAAMEAIRNVKRGVFIAKPRADQQLIIKRIQAAADSGANAWGIDIDSVSIPTFREKGELMSRKTLEDIKELASSTDLPFVLKGILTVEDAAVACESGATAIVVSNHGGRVVDSLPSTVSVLENIKSFVRSDHPSIKVLVDGGIRSGSDVFKMLCLGADGVLIGRPLVIATIAYGRLGAYSYLKRLEIELETICHNLGIKILSDFSTKYLKIPSG